MRCFKILLFFLLITLLLYSCQKNVNREKAQELYQMGRQVLLYDASLIDLGDNRADKTASYFEQAIALDSTFAPAYAALAYPMAVIKAREMSRADAFREAKKMVDKALTLDPTLCDAYVAM
jgi:Tfp pilus assembly protein PilF